METATTKEALGFTNNTKAITPFTLRQALKLYPTVQDMKDAINNASVGGGEGVDLSDYLKKSELPTKLSAFENDKQFIALVNGYVPVSYLPSSFHNIEIHDSIDKFPYPGNVNKLYFNRTDNKFYTYADGYVEIGETLSLGYTADTAFRGDYGLEAYTHITETGNVHNLTLADLQIAVSPDAINNLLGLDENILTLLSNKLDLSGGSLLGPLILQRDPVEEFEAATRNYVDREINSIGVKVTTNVNKLIELEDSIDSQKETLTSQKESIAEITNKVTETTETVKNIETDVTEIKKDFDGISIKVSETVKIVEDVQQSVKIFSCTLAQNAIVIQTNSNGNATETTLYQIPINATFKNTKVIPTLVSITPNDSILTVDEDSVNFLATKGSPVTQKNYGIIFSYDDSGKTYVDEVILSIVPLKIADPSTDQSGGGAHIGATPPEDTSILWVDTGNNVIKRYTITDAADDDGNPLYDWKTINEVDIDAIDGTLKELEERLKRDLETLNTTIMSTISSSIEASAKAITFKYEKYYSDSIKDVTDVQGEITGTIDDINKKVDSLVDIKKYMSWTDGNLVFGEVTENSSTNAYTLQIDNDSIIIKYGGKVLSQWMQDQFLVSKIIYKDNSLKENGEPKFTHGFQFIANQDGSFSLKRVDLEVIE
jgi:archaellum component FlaC